MKITAVAFEMAERAASFTLPLKGESFRCFIDQSDVLLLRARCTSITLHQPNPRVRYVRVVANGRQTTLHRFLLGLPVGDPRWGDHKNTDTLDYRRENLRIVDVGRNSLNHRTARSDSAFGIRCVKPLPNGRWSVTVRKKYIGVFDDLADAAETVWLQLLELDPVAATNFLHSLPSSPPA